MSDKLYNPDHFIESVVKPGHFGQGIDNIVILNNFIDLEDLKQVQSFLPKINKWVDTGSDEYSEDGKEVLYNASYWKDRQCSAEIILSLDKNIYNIIDKYINKMKNYLEDKFKVRLMARPPVIIRWFEGLFQEPHADKQLLDGSPNPFPNYDINSLIYYNEDFEGGELYYPQYDLEIKPSPGLAVAHPGDIFYLHGVRKIKSGQRWTTPSFYSIEELL